MSSRFNVGDKVRVAENATSTYDLAFLEDMHAYCGQVVTLDRRFSDEPCFRIKEDNGMYIWDESWFEPVYCGNPKMLTISFDPSDKSAAHKMVEEAIKNYYAPKDWTKEEVEQAKELVCEMAKDVIRNGGDLFFSREAEDNSIACSIYRDSFDWDFADVFLAKPHGKDIYNVWIGKCVALCKALKKPIPDFIRFKNT